MGILHEVQACGQEIWLDRLSRSLVRDGALVRWLQDGVSGLTSNPAIFQKAFAEDVAYAEDIAQAQQQGLDAEAVYETLALADLQVACDVLQPVYLASGGRSGRVSWEVAPQWAHDKDGTVAEALRLWQMLGRENAMIKVPATAAGIAAAEDLLAQGVSVNLTLLFSLDDVAAAQKAAERGLQRAGDAGVSPLPHLVASFFISRTDHALDILLPEHLRGRVACALAQVAYARWQQVFDSAQWQALVQNGVALPRLLWASTATKNPQERACRYVEQLIAANTVNTVPEAALQAFMAEGRIGEPMPPEADDAEALLAEVAALGIDLSTLATRLQEDGLQQFELAYAQLLAALEPHREA